MAVILPDRQMTFYKRAHPQERDAHGTPVAQDTDLITPAGPWPGAAAEQVDSTWNLRCDPRAWRLRIGDKITDDQGNVFIVKDEPKLTKIPGNDSVDFVRCICILEPPRTA